MTVTLKYVLTNILRVTIERFDSSHQSRTTRMFPKTASVISSPKRQEEIGRMLIDISGMISKFVSHTFLSGRA